MKYLVCIPSLFLVLAGMASAQTPTVSAGGIVNSASYAPAGLPNGSIAQGSFFTIFGTNLGPASSPSIAYPLPTTLGGVQVKVTSGGTTVNAFLWYVSPNQINAILPQNAATGAATLTVTYNGATSASAAFQIVASSFGIFAVNSAGSGPGIITGVNYQVYGLTSSAKPGDGAIIWGTGLGVSPGDDGAGPPKQVDLTGVPVSVWVGVQSATVLYRGRAPSTGEDQINILIPAGVTGCHVPVAVQIGNIVSNWVTMPISTSGGACSDASGPSPTDLSKYLQQGTVSIGSVVLSRTTTTTPGFPPPLGTGQATTSTNDSGSAVFERYTFQQVNSAQNPFMAYTLGTCVVYVGSGTSGSVSDPIKPVGLDAGSFIGVSGPNGAKQLTQTAGLKGIYSANLGGGTPPAAVLPLYLDPGSYTVTGPGGADVVGFSQNVNVPQPLVWTNESSINTIVRASGQDVTWSGGDPGGTVVITGFSIKAGTNPNGSDSLAGIFICTAPVNAGHFTVPPPVLLSLPPSTSIQITPGVSLSFSSMSIGTSSLTNVTPPPATLDLMTVDANVTVSKGGLTYQ